MNTIAFTYMLEEIRGHFPASEADALRKIYFPYDEGGMNFISIQDSSHEGFRAFFEAAEKARDACTRRGVNDYDVWWPRLFNILKRDPRANA